MKFKDLYTKNFMLNVSLNTRECVKNIGVGYKTKFDLYYDCEVIYVKELNNITEVILEDDDEQ